MPRNHRRRDTGITRHAVAGCGQCGGAQPRWRGANAQGVAARHHDATGHPTWCTITMSIAYGRAPIDGRQIDIEEAIRALA